jgi:hypothetical protein
VKATQWRLGLALTLAALAALGAWDYSTTRGNGISVYRTPYRVEMDCMRYSTRTGRVTMRIAVRNITRRPIRFRGHVFVTIRHDLPTTPDGRKHWHPYAMARGHTPLLTIAPGDTYEWSRRSRPILLHGSTKGLSSGGCGFYANPPRMPN